MSLQLTRDRAHAFNHMIIAALAHLDLDLEWAFLPARPTLQDSTVAEAGLTRLGLRFACDMT